MNDGVRLPGSLALRLSGSLFITESPVDTVQLSLFHPVTTSALVGHDQHIKIVYT